MKNSWITSAILQVKKGPPILYLTEEKQQRSQNAAA